MTDEPKRYGEFAWGPDDGAIRGPLANNARTTGHSMTMTREARVEAAAKIIEPTALKLADDDRTEWRERTMRTARKALDAAYPELAAGTHVLLPKEPTMEMVTAFINGPHGQGPRGLYQAMVSAYERQSNPESE